MSVKVVLFDLDGTLLPMDQDTFVRAYFGGISKKLAPHGYDPKKLIDTIWAGTAAMVKNNGSMTNEAAFWAKFTEVFGERATDDMPYFDEFYRDDFDKVSVSCGYAPESAEIIKMLKEKRLRVALATNPIFPSVATEKRMAWAGLKPDDFELYTTYENSRYCKPNPKYYIDIMEKLGVKPEDCLMVGNDVTEDMITKDLGMQVFLLTDNIINKENKDISVYPNGGFADLKAFLEETVIG